MSAAYRYTVWICICLLGASSAQEGRSLNEPDEHANGRAIDDSDDPVTTVDYTVLACSGHAVTMECRPGYSMQVVYAFWGRDNSYDCNHQGANPDLRCQVNSGAEKVREQCNGQQTCRVEAAPGLLGDCDQDTTKYLRASYRCSKDVYKALLCEQSGPMPLACPAGYVIETKGAFYGREDLNTTCPHATAVNSSHCSEQAASKLFEKLCNGKTTCKVSARTTLFGDPCPGSYKYLRLNYTCSACENEYGSDSMCDYWTALGSCPGSAWMNSRCRKACTRCDPKEKPCENVWKNDTECSKWEAQGDCKLNPAWMFTFCRKACLKCAQPTACINNYGNNTLCQEWLDQDQCKQNTDFMFSECAASCFNCDPDQSPAATIKFENQWQNLTECEMWAQWGECHKNPGWMIPNCLHTCLGYTSDPPCVNEYPDSECEKLAAQEECQKNAVYMHRHCWKSCMRCNSGTPECSNKLGNDARCEYRAHDGECKTNSAVMMDECYQSCSQCEPLDRNLDCVNRENDTKCDGWADGWECLSNADWMMTNCRRSCAMCDRPDNNLAQVGSPAAPGKVSELTNTMSFILPQPIKVSGKLRSFSAYFASRQPVRLQVWRTKANGWSTVYSQLHTPQTAGQAETIHIVGDCVAVEAGDRIGFTTIGNVSPIASSFDIAQVFQPTYFRDTAETDTLVKIVTDGLHFRQMTLPYKYSLSAAYDSRTICPGVDPEAVTVMVTKKVYFDLTHGGREVGRITFGLFEEIVPKTCANFVGLVEGHNGYSYQGNIFHRVINGFVMQAGDVVSQNGYGWTSIYGENFPDENFILKHVGPGILQMANAGPDTNGSQFAVMSSAQPHLNDRHVVFGRILEGMEVYRQMEAVPTNNEKPIEDIVIARCGVIRVDKPFPIKLKMEY